jgi:hypothetical protein
MFNTVLLCYGYGIMALSQNSSFCANDDTTMGWNGLNMNIEQGTMIPRCLKLPKSQPIESAPNKSSLDCQIWSHDCTLLIWNVNYTWTFILNNLEWFHEADKGPGLRWFFQESCMTRSFLLVSANMCKLSFSRVNITQKLGYRIQIRLVKWVVNSQSVTHQWLSWSP